jgi:hypothetical protein
MKDLTSKANFGFVRFFNNLFEPCTRWDEATKTGTWNWATVDLMINTIFSNGEEPIIVLGFYSWSTNGLVIPRGMTKNSVTGLPNPESWAAYCKAWISHFKLTGKPVKYYEIFNEAYQYWKNDGWPVAQPKLSYFTNIFNAAAIAMRSVDSNVKIGNDATLMKGVLDYFIANNVKIDYICYHNYATGSQSTSDSTILNSAETKYMTDTTSYYSVEKAVSVYQSKKGVTLPVLVTENNVNYMYSKGTDPRTQKMIGAVYHALCIRTAITKGYVASVYFNLASSASTEKVKSTGGYGLGMVNTDNSKPWLPYFVYQMIGQKLEIGDQLLEASSTSENVRVLSWKHNNIQQILIICKTTSQISVTLKGITNQLSYQSIDSSILWSSPYIKTGTLNADSSITLNGYTVMLLQKS